MPRNEASHLFTHALGAEYSLATNKIIPDLRLYAGLRGIFLLAWRLQLRVLLILTLVILGAHNEKYV